MSLRRDGLGANWSFLAIFSRMMTCVRKGVRMRGRQKSERKAIEAQRVCRGASKNRSQIKQTTSLGLFNLPDHCPAPKPTFDEGSQPLNLLRGFNGCNNRPVIARLSLTELICMSDRTTWLICFLSLTFGLLLDQIQGRLEWIKSLRYYSATIFDPPRPNWFLIRLRARLMEHRGVPPINISTTPTTIFDLAAPMENVCIVHQGKSGRKYLRCIVTFSAMFFFN